MVDVFRIRGSREMFHIAIEMGSPVGYPDSRHLRAYFPISNLREANWPKITIPGGARGAQKLFERMGLFRDVCGRDCSSKEEVNEPY